MRAIAVVLFLLSTSCSRLEAFGPSMMISTTTLRPFSTRLHQDTKTAKDTPSLSSNDDNTPPTPTSSFSPDMKAFANGYQTVFEELPFQTCTPSFGTIPSDLVGSYFKAGPAMFTAGSIVPPKKSIVQPRQPPVPDGTDSNRMVQHPFEGDGAVLGITFGPDATVSARFRFVRTVAFTAERKKGAKLYTGMESTRVEGGEGNDLPLPLFRHHLMPGLNKKRKNTSNTRAIYWGQRLFTLWEGGQPYKLDGRALSTEGRSRLGGAIRGDQDPFGAKMSVDAHNQRALFYGIVQGQKVSELTLYEFDPSFALVGRRSVDLPGCVIVNDFCTTRNFALVVAPTLDVNSMQFMVGKDPGKTLTLNDQQPALLHLIPRIDKQQQTKEVVSVPIPVSDDVVEANLQFCNAYERGDDEIIIDAIVGSAHTPNTLGDRTPPSWPWGDSLERYRSMACKKSLWRYTVNRSSGTVSKRQLSNQHGFFGTINPAFSSQKHRYIYMNVGGLGCDVAPPQGVVRLDTESGTTATWMPQSYEFCGEPMYAPRQGQTGEDSGYILSTLYNGKQHTSELIILKANNIQGGPLTRIPLDVTIPHGLFGCFTDDESACWTADSLQRRAKLADKMESQGNQWNEVKSDFSGLGLRFDDMEEYFGDFFN